MIEPPVAALAAAAFLLFVVGIAAYHPVEQPPQPANGLDPFTATPVTFTEGLAAIDVEVSRHLDNWNPSCPGCRPSG